MKKQLLCLLLLPAIVLGFAVSGCDKGNENSLEHLDNADLLALSYEKLENADLSFNFAIDKTVKAVDNSAKAVAAANKADSRKFETGYNNYVIVPSDYNDYNEEGFDYFEQQNEFLERIRGSARNIADFAINNVTVMNTVVNRGYYENYLMDYDSKNDILTVSRFSYSDDTYTDLEEFSRVKIYYDNDGDETVEMFNFVSKNKTVQNIERVVYTPNKYYYIINNYQNETYSFDVAYNSQEGWRGLSTYFNPDNPYLTGNGTYDYANGMINLRFLIEYNDTVYTFADYIIAYKQGMETGSGVAAAPDDELRIKQYGVFSPAGLDIVCEANIISLNLRDIEGWDSVKFNGYVDRDVCYDYMFDSADDVISLSNGTEININNNIWTKEFGLIKEIDGVYYDKDDNVVNFVEENCAEIFKIRANDMVYYWDQPNNPQKSYNGQIDFTYQDEKLPLDEQIALLSDCFKELGLSLNGAENTDVIDTLAYLQANKQRFTTDIFTYLLDKEYNAKEIRSAFKSIENELSVDENSIKSYLNEFEKIEYNNLPKKPENIGLVNLSENIQGKAKLDKDGIDFSSIKVTVNKSIILSEDNKYTIVTGWSNATGTLFAEAFSPVIYSGNAMEFAGNAAVALPASVEGEYTLKSFFGKITENGYIRLSEIISTPVERFETFEIKIPAEGGYYLNKYYSEGNDIKLKVTFVAQTDN